VRIEVTTSLTEAHWTIGAGRWSMIADGVTRLARAVSSIRDGRATATTPST
jgi:hypothetical protein